MSTYLHCSIIGLTGLLITAHLQRTHPREMDFLSQIIENKKSFMQKKKVVLSTGQCKKKVWIYVITSIYIPSCHLKLCLEYQHPAPSRLWQQKHHFVFTRQIVKVVKDVKAVLATAAATHRASISPNHTNPIFQIKKRGPWVDPKVNKRIWGR